MDCSTITNLFEWAKEKNCLIELAQAILEIANTPDSVDIHKIIDLQSQSVWNIAYT